MSKSTQGANQRFDGWDLQFNFPKGAFYEDAHMWSYVVNIAKEELRQHNGKGRRHPVDVCWGWAKGTALSKLERAVDAFSNKLVGPLVDSGLFSAIVTANQLSNRPHNGFDCKDAGGQVVRLRSFDSTKGLFVTISREDGYAAFVAANRGRDIPQTCSLVGYWGYDHPLRELMQTITTAYGRKKELHAGMPWSDTMLIKPQTEPFEYGGVGSGFEGPLRARRRSVRKGPPIPMVLESKR